MRICRLTVAGPRRQQTIRLGFLALVLSLWAGLAHAQKKLPDAPLNLNTASAEQLQQLPGVGPATAQAIIRFREKSGPFRRVEDLLAISGITERRLNELRPHVTVTPAPPRGSGGSASPK